MNRLTYLFLFLASVGFAQTPITDANFNEAITICLSTNPVDGLCYDSEYGAMPDWDVSQVTYMVQAFAGRPEFNADISAWDVSNVTNMERMFWLCSNFNQPIGNWDVSNVTQISLMFSSTSFNQPIGDWDISSVSGGTCCVFENSPFNQDISSWDVSNVTSLSKWFIGTPFNQDISSWDVSNVTDLFLTFYGAYSFNQDIGDWDVGNVTTMQDAFHGANSFNQNLSDWDVSSVTNMGNMLTNSGLSVENYDATLEGWSTLNLQNNVTLGAGGLQYCNSEEERQSIIDNFGWTITDEGIAPDCIPAVLTALCQDITIELDAFGMAEITAENIDNGSAAASGTTNLSYAVDQSVFNCDDIGAIEVTMTITAANGDQTSCTSTVTVLSPITDLTISVDGETASTTNNTASYQWLDCDDDYAPIAGATNQSYTPPSSGNFALELTEGGCVDTTACVYIVPTSTTNLQSNTLSIYPNPTQDIVTINLDSPSKGILKAYDLQGRLIHSQSLQGLSSLDYTIEGEAGLYLIEFVDERGEVYVGKVVKVD